MDRPFLEEVQDQYQPAFSPVGVHLTLVPDVEYPWPEEVVRACRRFDPRLVPIFRRKVYRSRANGLYVFRHHGFAAYDPEKPQDPALLRATRPVTTGYPRQITTPAPNVISRWFEPKIESQSRRFLYNLPAPFVPFTSWVERWVEETYWEASAAKKAAYTDQADATERRKARESAADDAEQQKLEDRHWNQKNLDALSEEDLTELRARGAGIDYRSPKPFVDHGRKTA